MWFRRLWNSSDAVEVLDENIVRSWFHQDTEGFFNLGSFVPNDNGRHEPKIYQFSKTSRFLAYSIDLTGDEKFTIYIKDLTTNETLPEAITKNCYSITWISTDEFLYNNLPTFLYNLSK